MLVAFAGDAVLQVLHFRGGIGLHRLPPALRAAGGLLGFVVDGTLTGGDVCLGLVDAGLDLLAGFLPGLVEGTLQLCRPLLQGVYLVGNVHWITPRSGPAGNPCPASGLMLMRGFLFDRGASWTGAPQLPVGQAPHPVA